MNRAQLSTSKEPDHIRCRHLGNMFKVRNHTFGFRLPNADFFSLQSAAESPLGADKVVDSSDNAVAASSSLSFSAMSARHLTDPPYS